MGAWSPGLKAELASWGEGGGGVWQGSQPAFCQRMGSYLPIHRAAEGNCHPPVLSCSSLAGTFISQCTTSNLKV